MGLLMVDFCLALGTSWISLSSSSSQCECDLPNKQTKKAEIHCIEGYTFRSRPKAELNIMTLYWLGILGPVQSTCFFRAELYYIKVRL